MAERLSFDTTFLIDLQKEKRSSRKGSAHRFLELNASALISMGSIALGEFAEGFSSRSDPLVLQIAGAFQILDVDDETGWIYGRQARRLRNEGRLIGSNDLWIACAAIRHELPLVTRDPRHFRRVEGLQLIVY